MNIWSLIFISLLLDVHTKETSVFLQIFNARVINYDKFHNVDYKIITLPPNLYDLTVSIKTTRWIGFMPLCPKNVNVTVSFQYGTFPLFKYDYTLMTKYGSNDSVYKSIFDQDILNSTITFLIKSPKEGQWFWGSIYDNNDDFEHYVICSIEVQVTLTGMILSPKKEINVALLFSPLTIPFTVNVSNNVLIELRSSEPLSRLKIELLCEEGALIISPLLNSVPQIRTIAEAKSFNEVYKCGDVVMDLRRPQFNLRVLLQIRSVYGLMRDSKLIIRHNKVSNDKNVKLLGPTAKVRGETMFTFKLSLTENVQLRTIPIILSHGRIVILPFYIEPIRDQGGYLSIDFSLSKINRNSSANCSIIVCISASGFSRSQDFIKTRDECIHSFNAVTNHSFYYPRWGWWYITLMINNSDQSTQWKLDLGISSKRCKSNCNRRGICLLNAFDNGLVSSCHCFRPFYGLDCAKIRRHDQYKLKKNIYKRNWLVWSNLAFIPPIIVSIIQKIYLLSIVYGAAAVFSMIYHMCSIEDIDIKSCILPLEQLVFYDHFAAALCIWSSLVTLSTLSSKIQAMLNVSMIFAFIVMGHIIQKSVWMYAVPVIGGMFIIIICWSYRIYCLKCIFPPIDWWMFGFVPGMILVVTAFVFFRLSTYEDYKYFLYHSIWHILIGVSICFLLPNSNRWSKALKKISSSDMIEEEHSASRKKWRKFKKNINYYLHLDVVLDSLILHYPRCSILKSY